PTSSANPVTAGEGSPEANGAQKTLTGTIPTITICAFPTIQLAHALTRDGGGSITVWQDERNAQKDLYAQRLNSGGFPVWAVGGLPVCKAAGEQLSPRLVSDGAGGAIVVWEDLRSDAGDIYAQRIDASGILRWTTTGVP